MKPKTKLQHEVTHLRNSYQQPVKQHEKFMISKHEFYYSTHYKNLICLECNHSWKPELQFWQEEVAGVKCPCCKKQLKKGYIENGIYTRVISYMITETIGRFQVFRYYSCWKRMFKKKKPDYWFHPMFEEWREYDTNKSVFLGGTSVNWGDGFAGDYSIRYVNTKWGGHQFGHAADYNCPNPQFLKRFNKYGLDDENHDCDVRYLIDKMEKHPEVETLFKAKKYKLLFCAVHKDDKYLRFWSQIKIAMRHNYEIEDPGIWYDYLTLLKYFDKDIKNPIFILPENLNEAHDKYVEKKKTADDLRRAKEEEKAKEIERQRAEAEKALKGVKIKLKDLLFKSGKIEIIPLIKAIDVKKEGQIHNHCVHTNNYHKKTGTLLMSARIGDKRLETVEISLRNFSILQCRGLSNKPTPHHDRIIEIVKKNMPKISTIVQKHVKLKTNKAA